MSTPPPDLPALTRPLRPGDQGELVAVLHGLLMNRGVLDPEATPEAIARLFGKVTRASVRSFQREAGLTADGIVGQLTWAALAGAPLPAGAEMPPPDYTGAGPFGAALLRVADEEWRAGVHEQPLGTNRGAAVDTYLMGHDNDGIDFIRWRRDPRVLDGVEPGWQGAPWCARFAAWCAEEAAIRSGLTNPAARWGHLAGATRWRDQAQKAHRLRSDPRPGDIGILLVPEEHSGHVVVVAGVAGGQVLTREGNCLDVLGAKRRDLDEFADGGFVTLD